MHYHRGISFFPPSKQHHGWLNDVVFWFVSEATSWKLGHMVISFFFFGWHDYTLTGNLIYLFCFSFIYFCPYGKLWFLYIIARKRYCDNDPKHRVDAPHEVKSFRDVFCNIFFYYYSIPITIQRSQWDQKLWIFLFT